MLITSPQRELGDTYPVVPVEESPGNRVPAASARRDEMVVSGQPPRATSGQILLSAHRRTGRRQNMGGNGRGDGSASPE